MARPRKFDEEEVVQKAMMAFWQFGYEGTTMKTLKAATNVDGKGLSNAFGDKEQLFLRSLEAYTVMYRNALSDIFVEHSLASLKIFFGGLIEGDPSPDDPANNGCLMVNTVVELGNANPLITLKIETYRTMFVVHFRKSLEASDVPEPEGKAELLLGMLWGALTQIRLSGKKSAATPMALQILEILESWSS